MNIVNLAEEICEGGTMHIAVVFSSKRQRKAAINEARRNGLKSTGIFDSDYWEAIATDEYGACRAIAFDINSKASWSDVDELWFEDGVTPSDIRCFENSILRTCGFPHITRSKLFSDALDEYSVMIDPALDDVALVDFIHELST